MIRTVSKNVEHDWVLFDSGYGKLPWLLDELQDDGERFMGQIPENTRIIPGKRTSLPIEPRMPIEVRKLMNHIPDALWHRLKFRDGAKGPDVADFFITRVFRTPCKCDNAKTWLVIRRELNNPKELRYYLSNAPIETSVETLAAVSSQRNSVELCFRESNSETGMDEYQLRKWYGWHHHMTLSILAEGFLSLGRMKMQKMMPTISIRQTGMLIQNILNKVPETLDSALGIVHHWQERNATAQRWHTAMRKRQLMELGTSVA